MSGQSKIVVGAKHQQAAALVDDFGTFMAIQRDEIGIPTTALGVFDPGETVALQVVLPFAIPEPPALLVQRTSLISLLSEAVPLMAMEEVVVG